MNLNNQILFNEYATKIKAAFEAKVHLNNGMLCQSVLSCSECPFKNECFKSAKEIDEIYTTTEGIKDKILVSYGQFGTLKVDSRNKMLIAQLGLEKMEWRPLEILPEDLIAL